LRRDAYEQQALEKNHLKRKEQSDIINQLANLDSKNVDEIVQNARKGKKKEEGFKKIKLVHVKVSLILIKRLKKLLMILMKTLTKGKNLKLLILTRLMEISK
jgi:hypothetical protein